MHPSGRLAQTDVLPDKELRFQTTDTTVILSVTLGSDFNEHDYHH